MNWMDCVGWDGWKSLNNRSKLESPKLLARFLKSMQSTCHFFESWRPTNDWGHNCFQWHKYDIIFLSSLFSLQQCGISYSADTASRQSTLAGMFVLSLFTSFCSIFFFNILVSICFERIYEEMSCHIVPTKQAWTLQAINSFETSGGKSPKSKLIEEKLGKKR